MSHVDYGIRKILNSNQVYRFYQWLVKKRESDVHYVNNYIKPFHGCRILDIGCGPGGFLDYYDNSVQYFGFDMNQDYINFAKNKFKEKGNFFCKPVNEELVLENKKYDIITANALIHHLTDSEAKKLFSIASELLDTNGRLITLDPVYIQNQNFISKFMIQNDRGQAIRDRFQFEKISKEYFEKFHSSYQNNYYVFPYDLIINVFYK